jgi:cathepsin D
VYDLIPGSAPETNGFYDFPCNAVLPDISLYFGGRQFSMTQSFNFGPTYRGSSRCLGGIRAREDVQWWTVGIAFMTNYYTIFDVGQTGVTAPEVGFATLA